MERERERETWLFISHIPNTLRYQFTKDFTLKISDACCIEMKEKPMKAYAKKNKRNVQILGLMKEEKGRRSIWGKCVAYRGKKVTFSPLMVMTKEWEDWYIKMRGIKLCSLYYPPYNCVRTGCKGCPYAINLQNNLDMLQQYFPAEKRQCEYIWKPVYEEYRRLGYRLRKDDGQQTIWDYL